MSALCPPLLSLWGFTCTSVRFLLCPQHLILRISTALLSARPSGGFYPLLCISLVLSLSCAICFSSHLCSCSFLSFLYFSSRISIGFFFFSFNSLLKFSIFHLCLEHIAHILRFLLTMAMSVTRGFVSIAYSGFTVIVILCPGTAGDIGYVVVTVKKTGRLWRCSVVQNFFFFCPSSGVGPTHGGRQAWGGPAFLLPGHCPSGSSQSGVFPGTLLGKS